MNQTSRFLGHPKTAGAEAFRDIFGSKPDHADFEIMNQGRSVHGHGGEIATVHQVDQHRAQAALDNMTAQTPDDGLALAARSAEGSNDGPETLAGKNIR